MSDGFDDWEQSVRDDLVPKLRGSAVMAQIVPGDDPDVKCAVELGMAILLDKPLILIVTPGRRVPERLARAADALIEWDGVSPDVGERVAAAMRDIDGGGSGDD